MYKFARINYELLKTSGTVDSFSGAAIKRPAMVPVQRSAPKMTAPPKQPSAGKSTITGGSGTGTSTSTSTNTNSTSSSNTNTLSSTGNTVTVSSVKTAATDRDYALGMGKGAILTGLGGTGFYQAVNEADAIAQQLNAPKSLENLARLHNRRNWIKRGGYLGLAGMGLGLGALGYNGYKLYKNNQTTPAPDQGSLSIEDI